MDDTPCGCVSLRSYWPVNARINFQILNIVNQDSGALGPLGMVIHQFSEPGTYDVGVHRQGRRVASTVFDVDPAGERQIEIHLAALARHGPIICEALRVAPNGFVLFHASGGDGYSATVTAGAERTIFDTARLGNGDIYATSLLEPGRYKLANTAGSATAEVRVASAGRDEEPVYVEVTETSFTPANIQVSSSQGLVFRVKQPARIVITRRHGPPSERVLQWRDPAEVG